jgi:hypothetical protein
MSDEFRNTDISDLVTPTEDLVPTKELDAVDLLPKIDNPARPFFHNYMLLKFMQKMKKMPFEAIDSVIVDQTYPVAVWKMREFALMGLYTETRAMELWLKWAREVIARPKRETKTVSKGSAKFGPREPEVIHEDEE